MTLRHPARHESDGKLTTTIKMGRQPRSGDFPWLSAHSILNWIGGDTSMLDPSVQMSSILSFIFLIACGWISEAEIASACVDSSSFEMLALTV